MSEEVTNEKESKKGSNGTSLLWTCSNLKRMTTKVLSNHKRQKNHQKNTAEPMTIGYGTRKQVPLYGKMQKVTRVST